MQLHVLRMDHLHDMNHCTPTAERISIYRVQ